MVAEVESKKLEKMITPLDISILELSKAIKTAKHSTEFFTDDFKDITVLKKPVEISIKNAEFILDYLQRRTDNVISKMAD